MAPRVLASAAVVAFALTAWGQQQPPSSSGSPGLLNCTPNNCKVAVTVTGDCANPANINVNPDTLSVPKANHNQKIEWNIQTDHFNFVPAPNGIRFTTRPIPPATEFTNPHGNGKKYDLTDTNSPTPNGRPIDYKYDIHLQRDNGTPCAVKDPTIRNGT
jgi:hypothetical protein